MNKQVSVFLEFPLPIRRLFCSRLSRLPSQLFNSTNATKVHTKVSYIHIRLKYTTRGSSSKAFQCYLILKALVSFLISN